MTGCHLVCWTSRFIAFGVVLVVCVGKIFGCCSGIRLGPRYVGVLLVAPVCRSVACIPLLVSSLIGFGAVLSETTGSWLLQTPLRMFSCFHRAKAGLKLLLSKIRPKKCRIVQKVNDG